MQTPERTMLDDAAGAGAALYQRCAPAIFVYLLKQTASREDAEGLLLEVFLAAMERDNLADLKEPEQRAIKRLTISGGGRAIPVCICGRLRNRCTMMRKWNPNRVC